MRRIGLRGVRRVRRGGRPWRSHTVASRAHCPLNTVNKFRHSFDTSDHRINERLARGACDKSDRARGPRDKYLHCEMCKLCAHPAGECSNKMLIKIKINNRQQQRTTRFIRRRVYLLLMRSPSLVIGVSLSRF